MVSKEIYSGFKSVKPATLKKKQIHVFVDMSEVEIISDEAGLSKSKWWNEDVESWILGMTVNIAENCRLSVKNSLFCLFNVYS